MDQPSLEIRLHDLHLPAVRFFPVIDSTNDEAWRWMDAGAPDRSLVVADEQTAGRGRARRRWVTPPGTALAFSLVLRSPPLSPGMLSRLTGLGALAVCTALQERYALPSQVKWPNDVLIDSRKVGGVLVESRWSGQALQACVIGIGINIAPASLSALDLLPEGLNFPAACIEEAAGRPVDRMELLHAILREIFYTWLPRLSQPEFIAGWEARLAYRDQWVELFSSHAAVGFPGQAGNEQPGKIMGKVLGLTQEGSLQLVTTDGTRVTVAAGEIHLRPATAASHPIPAD